MTKFFWTATKGSRQKKQDISKKKKVDNKENSEMFFEVLAWKTNLQEKLKWGDMVKKAGRDICPPQKKGGKKIVEMRRHWSGFTLDSKFTQHNFHYTCNLALHKPLWRTRSSFLFLFGWWDEAPASQRKTLTTLSLYCAFRNLDSFWTLFFEGTCLSIALRQVLAPPWAAPLVNWTTRFLRLRSCLVRSFSLGIFSCPLFHLCSSITPTLHHYRVKPPRHPFSVNLVPFQNIARVHPPRFSDLANSFFQYRWTGSSPNLRPKSCWTEAWPFMVFLHVLFVDDESHGDSICHFACLL